MNEPKPQPRDIMSETPKVEALSRKMVGKTLAEAAVEFNMLAGQLERELDAAQTEIIGLNGIIRVRNEALTQAQARCAELEKANAAAYRDFVELRDERNALLARMEQLRQLGMRWPI